jgi:beta propeller repeat protein
MPGSRGGGWGFGLKRSGRPIRILILVAALSLILVAGKGHGMQCLITVNTSSTDQWHPDVSGDTIAWEDASDRSIHLYNLSTGIESRVAISTVTQSYPAISGSLVAWQEGTGISARNLPGPDLERRHHQHAPVPFGRLDRLGECHVAQYLPPGDQHRRGIRRRNRLLRCKQEPFRLREQDRLAG